MKIDRRSLFPLAAAGMLATGTGAEGASIDEKPGIVIRLAKHGGEWRVLVPDFDSMPEYWRPGMIIALKWMPIHEYLDMVDKVFEAP